MSDWAEARRKLKFPADARILELGNGPSGLLQGLPRAAENDADVVFVWVHNVAELEALAGAAVAAYGRGRALWFAYPKRTSRLAQDLSRDHGWKVLADQDIHAVTQVAIDADYSALRWRHRDEIATFTRRF